MSEKKDYICVNCGVAAAALYRNYGPSVLKLTKCESCKGIVDKYIEYDPVIVAIDLVLMSREAQRHIIYNTEFKSYWKLFIMLMLLETFAVWRNETLFNVAINTICDIKNNSTINSTHISLPINFTIPDTWKVGCQGWVQSEKDGSDLFIWEKDFYILFLSTFAGIIMFISSAHILMSLCARNKAPARRVLRSFVLANASALFSVPALVWGPGAARRPHRLLVAPYGLLTFYGALRVLYDGPRSLTVVVLIVSNCMKYLTTFHVTPFLRNIMNG